MPLPVPVLDNKTFDDLASEAQALIPRTFPAWTDRNPSDPGITLLELFAFLAEATYYQLDRIPARTLRRFAELAGTSGTASEPVEALLSRSVRTREAINRAVTPGDSEFVARSGIFAISPPLPLSLASGTPVVALTPLPGTVSLTAAAAAGNVQLTVTDASSLRAGDVLLLDGTAPGQVKPEFTTVTAVGSPSKGAVVTLAAPLASGHAAGPPLARMAQPAGVMPGTLLRDAPPGARVLTVDPSAGLPSGWLRLGTGPAATYVQATSAARTKVVTQVTSSANVYPADLVTTVLVVPSDGNPPPAPLLQAVFDLMRDRSPITTRVRVAAPRYCPVQVTATVVRAFPALLRKDTVQQRAQAALQRFLDPVLGGEGGSGWQFGRAVYRSELYQVLQDTTGVDHVQQLLLNGDPAVEALPLSPDPAQAAVSLVRLAAATVTVVDG